MLIHKGLVDVDISNDVIAYKANQLTHLLLTYFESEYFSILSRETLLVVNEMSKFTKNELQEFVNEKLTTWHTFIEFDWEG